MPDNAQPESTTATPNQEYAQKIEQLTREKLQAEQAARERDEAQARRLEELTQTVEEIRQQNRPKEYNPKDPMGAMTDEDLHTIALQGPDPENPAKYQLAQDEMLRRREQKLRQEMQAERARERQAQIEAQSLRETMTEKFGDDVLKKGTPLNRAAEKHMAELQRRYGREIAYNPQAQMAAAAMAKAELVMEENEKRKEHERELTQLKQRSQMERGNQVVQQPTDNVRSILKNKAVPHDQRVRGAVKEMNLFERLFGAGG